MNEGGSIMTVEEILEKLKVLLSEQLGVDKNSISINSRLVEDLGADSLDIVDLVEAVEAEFEIDISDERIENIHTINDVVSYIAEVKDSDEYSSDNTVL